MSSNINLSIFFSPYDPCTPLESISFQLNVKKTMKENLEIIRILYVGVDHVIQSKIQ